MKKTLNKSYLIAAITGYFLITPVLANASAFEMFAENGSELGNAYAGSSAIALDASTNYFNPAGLVVFDTRQVTYSTILRYSTVDFTGNSLWQVSPVTVTPNNSFQQTGTAESHGTNLIPAFNEAIPFDKRYALGLSVVMPFDFSTNYAENSVLRFAGTNSSIYVVDITPSLAYEINPKWSIGVGFDADRASLTMNYMIGLPVAINNVQLPSNISAESENSATGWGMSGHGGILYQYSPHTRFGLSYHAPVSFHLSGDSNLLGALAQTANGAGLVSTGFGTNLKLPDYAELSVYQQLGNKWELLGSLDYIRWSLLNSLNLHDIQSVSPTQPILTNMVVPLHLRNAFRVSAGANYFVNPHIKLLAGIAYDEGASSTQTAINFPDNANIALATGATYIMNKFFSFDVGYSHIFNIGTTHINSTTQSAFQQVNILGTVKRSENLIGAQITWNIGYLGAKT